MSLRLDSPIHPDQARQYSPLQLAHLGDAVWELAVRSTIAWKGRNVRHMHSDAISMVNAHAQALALDRMDDILTPEEQDIVRRGRNAHAHHAAPKNQDPGDYSKATALETLMGYLYMTGQDARILELFQKCWEVHPDA